MSTAKLKVDEDLPLEVVDLLRAAGHDAMTVVAQQMVGWSDDQVWEAIVSEGRSLITADVGFADGRRVAQAPGVGIVLLRLWPESRRGYVELMTALLSAFALSEVVGKVVSVSADAVRVFDPRVREHHGPSPAEGG